jgi:hypothetical protein
MPRWDLEVVCIQTREILIILDKAEGMVKTSLLIILTMVNGEQKQLDARNVLSLILIKMTNGQRCLQSLSQLQVGKEM